MTSSYETAALNAGITMLSAAASITAALGSVAPSSRIVKADGGGSPDGTMATALDGTQFATAQVPLWFIVDHKGFNRELISLAGYKYTGVFLLQLYQAIPANTTASAITDGARDFAGTVLDQIITQIGGAGCFSTITRAEIVDVGIVDEVSDLGAPGTNPGYTVAEYELEWLAFGSAGTVAPQPPAGMILWLNGGTAVVSGSTVNWPDSSGNALDATGSGTLSVTTIGGNPYVTGFGVSNFLTSALSFGDTAGYHIYVVCQVSSYASGNCILGSDGNTSPSVMSVFLAVGDSGESNTAYHLAGVNGASFQSVSAGVPALNVPILCDAGLGANGGTQTCKLNTMSEVSQAYPYGTNHGTTTGTKIGGRQYDATDYFNGAIAEILVYPPTQDPAAVRAYLCAKYGLTP